MDGSLDAVTSEERLAAGRRVDIVTLLLVVLPLMIAVAVTYRYYTHLASTEMGNFYSMLGKAFLQGHTYLDLIPSPELLALPDPYDPAVNTPYLLWDASLYNGKYFLYFGPVPAALFWVPVKFISGIDLNDPQIVLGQSIVGTFALFWLLAQITARERLYSRAGLAIALVAMGFGTWLPFMLRRPSFYEVAVSGAYCFSALGLLALWYALKPLAKRASYWLALSSLCFGFAVGCRLIHVFNLSILLIAFLVVWRSQRRPWLATALRALGPWSLCMMAYMIYNYARFDSIFESGAHYQLTSFNVHSPDFHMLRMDRLIPNAYFYLFRPLDWMDTFTFPFFHLTYYQKFPLSIGVTVETYEPVYGLFANSPFSLFLLAAPLCRLGRGALSRETRVLTACIALYGECMLGFLLFFFFTTTRYAVDFSPWLMLFAAIQYLLILHRYRLRRAIYVTLLILGGAAALYGAFTNTMSGYCGQYLCEPAPT